MRATMVMKVSSFSFAGIQEIGQLYFLMNPSQEGGRIIGNIILENQPDTARN